MNDTQAPTPAAALFQKAHGKILMMQRVDAQIAALLTQRRRLQEEINGVQSQINEEFDRLSHESAELPARLLSEISGGAGNVGRLGEIPALEPAGRIDQSETVAQYREAE